MTFGQAGDIPDPGNYDGLGYDQLAVYRPSTGQFLVLEPNGTTETLNLGVSGSPDLSGLVPVPGGYDNLDYFNGNESERTEAAVYDPKVGMYTILGPGGNTYTVSGFLPGDIPAPADYLGSGSTQAAVFRPSTGQFIGAGGTIIATFGQSGDIPLAAPLSYRMPSSDPPTGTRYGNRYRPPGQVQREPAPGQVQRAPARREQVQQEQARPEQARQGLVRVVELFWIAVVVHAAASPKPWNWSPTPWHD